MGMPLYVIEAPGCEPRRVTSRAALPDGMLRLGEPGRGRVLVEIPVVGEGRFFSYVGGKLVADDRGREDGPALVRICAVGAYSRHARYDIHDVRGRLDILARGVIAFGDAGRVNSGPDVLAYIEPGTTFRLNGKYESYVYRYSRSGWEVVPWAVWQANAAVRRTGQPEGPVYRCLTLRGDEVVPGIPVVDGMVRFTPRWGLTRREHVLAAVRARRPEEIKRVYYARVLRPAEGNGVPVLSLARKPQDRRCPELVLVQSYRPGVGAKRWPAFDVALDDFVEVLSEASTSGGSGWERWRLIIAPPGWARNIAGQFVNRRDEPAQTIYYRPRLRRAGVHLEGGVGGQMMVHLDPDPLEVIRGVEAMEREGWTERLRSRFVHLFGPPEGVATFVYRVPLQAFTVNGALVVPPGHSMTQKKEETV